MSFITCHLSNISQYFCQDVLLHNRESEEMEFEENFNFLSTVILILSGIELSIFIVACMVLWMVFVMKTVLIHRNVSVIDQQCLHSTKAVP